MNIIFNAPHLNVCGGVRVLLRLAENLTNRGHAVTLLANKTNAGPFWLLASPKFNIVQCEEKYTKFVPDNTDVFIDFLDGNISALPKGVKRVLFLQGYGTQDKEKEDTNLFRDFDAVIATSKWLADIANNLRKRRVFIIPPGVDAYFKPEISVKQYFHIGGLYHRSASKNTNLFIGVANSFYKYTKGMSTPILIAAKYPKDDTLLGGFMCPFSLMVNAPQKTMPKIYSAMSAWISTSSNEGFGLTALEAMACGVPVIMYPNLGLDQFVVHEENCLTGRNEREILENLYRLKQDVSLQQKLITNGMALANTFTWERATKAFENALESIV